MAHVVLKLLPFTPESAYAVLTVSASYSDRVIRGFLPADAVSESTQWVFLDDFGRLEQIPLDQYEDRLENFDPRNDGYAEKVRKFFIREGKRFFFLPLKSEFWGTLPVSDTRLNRRRAEKTEAALREAFGDIPFSIAFFIPHEQPFMQYGILFGVAGVGAVALSSAPFMTAALLPILGALVCAGPWGLALGGVILGFAGVVTALIRGRYITQGLLYMLMLGLWAGVFWDVPGLFGPPGAGIIGRADRYTAAALGTAAFVCAGGVILAAGADELRRTVQACLPRPGIRRSIGGAGVPFMLVSVMALHIPPAEPPSFSPAGITAADYAEHIRFQRSFSVTPLFHEQAGEYQRYVLGADGLIAGPETPLPPTEAPGIPTFPLQDLIAFFSDFPHTQPQTPAGTLVICSISPLLLVLGERMLELRTKPQRKKKHHFVYNERQLAT